MNSFDRWRILGALALAGAVLGSVGCSAEAGSDVKAPADEAAQAQQAAGAKGASGRPEAKRGFPGHGPGGGPGFLLGAALHELTLTDAQRSTIEAAMEKAKPAGRPGDHGPMGGAAHAALAEGVRAGKIDAAAVIAKMGAEPADMDEHRAALAEALTTLHDTLTKEQRRALVDSVKKHAEEGGPRGEHAGMMGRPGPDGRGGPPGAPPPPGEEGFHGHGPDGARGGPHGGPLGFLLGGLNLTDAQKESIHKALMAQKPGGPDGPDEGMKKDFEAMRAEMTARLEAFAADTFDAKAFLTPPKGGMGGPKKHFERMVNDLAVVVPLLDPAQREALAAQIEKGPPPPPEGQPGGPPGKRGPGGAPPPR